MPQNAPRISTVLAVLLGFALVLAILGVAYLVYDFSLDGLAFVIGKAAAPFVLLFLISLPWRKSARRLPVVLGITLFFFVVGSAEDVLDALDMREARPLIAVSKDLDDFQRHAREHPDNRVLTFMASVMEIRDEHDTRLLELAGSLEPAGIPAVIHLERMDGQQLRMLADASGQAEQNARAALPKMDAIVADMRIRIEMEAKSMPRLANDLLAGFDAGGARARLLGAAFLQGREEYYRALHAVAGFLAANQGTYSLSPEGDFQFLDQASEDSFSRLEAQVRAAWEKMAEAGNAVHGYEEELAARFIGAFGGSRQ